MCRLKQVQGWRAGTAVLVAVLAFAVAAVTMAATPPNESIATEIVNPAQYWADNGFVALVPAIRVSVTPGSKTAIYLRIPDGRKIATRFLPDQARYTLQLPPGSAADRVSYSRRADGTFAIDDVRGTRWDDNGAEFFHVYRPLNDGGNPPLSGFEWRRGDHEQQSTATALLTELVQFTSDRFPSLRASRRDVARFQRLNNCQMCHLPDKPVAQTIHDPLPPWQTDALGLYVPLAVLQDWAPMSTTPYFDDPNADDPDVSATCSVGYPKRHRNFASRWFSCNDESVPIGHYNLANALTAGHNHAQLVCAARRYLFDRLDDLGRQAFADAIRRCEGS